MRRAAAVEGGRVGLWDVAAASDLSALPRGSEIGRRTSQPRGARQPALLASVSVQNQRSPRLSSISVSSYDGDCCV